MKPLISVVMISYNHQDFIEDALLSVIQQVNESYDLEILIVDDGSSDNTRNIIERFQEQYPQMIKADFKEHVGVTAINKNLNEQISKAKGDYVAFLACDDKFMPNRFGKQLAVFSEDKKVDLVISDGINYQVNNGIFLERCQEQQLSRLVESGECDQVYDYVTSNISGLYIQGYLCKRDLLISVGGFDESVIADDWVLNIRLFKYLSENMRKVVYQNDVVFQRNLHSTNTSFHFEDQYLRIQQVAEKYVRKDVKDILLAELNFRYIKLAVQRLLVLKAIHLMFRYVAKDPQLQVLRRYIKKQISRTTSMLGYTKPN